ncbi:anaerobic glycerol-3-phosphate dehydrogenase subunit B [Actinobacillus succinogenes]|uniref:Anaerobic glycerol-3-phosphate dehydrogenase subunit B n=1 Tax=Actinobacillus succinogenes (strain ATCC 55618 / DSM 22257 / CCUG 43843 / 130Z) TaxID=339671 RepID=GLPB_ACTSZ|nr:glycerol-3-phosphate dehydrogenase subunit GlpB [Actinobacillus succinogenes]A6VKT7.1 RecName: Full=Anaerobic glycerol-3-phosphate dehydrogenase subunit B; Short=Anaerobic G-3-P dehydrogenase subunit B; Short=Anaerobic G3Pdhase B [Actinobacillus succinogenes 130Z]ABR73584.1 Glycerol-3-phosphate dehydrogenase [Actinobacillus succinogenes 130Z]PHI39956.1 anaerobic glycerol-3-phosphate dehydrogenase subunit B [Actinobacillus succinogenes]
MNFDVVIIGGGLAGLTCGIALQEQGKRCAIVNNGQAAMDFSTGSIDLLGRLPNGENVQKVDRALAGLSEQLPAHPYAKLGAERVLAKAKQFEGMAAKLNLGLAGSVEQNHARVTPLGGLRRTWLSPDSVPTVRPNEAFPYNNIVILGIEGYHDFQPQLLADNLKLQPQFAHCEIKPGFLTIPELDFLRRQSREFRSVHIAQTLEQKVNPASLINEIRQAASGADVVFLPACFGQNSQAFFNELQAATDFMLFELPTLPPSLLGGRQHNILRQYFERLGGVMMNGDRALRAEFEGNRVVKLFTRIHEDEPLAADNYVLASGSFFSNGLVAEFERIYEPVFGADIVQTERFDPSDHFTWTTRRFSAPQPYQSAGVVINTDCRVQKCGRFFDNLYAAGAVIGGFNGIELGCGSGVAVVTALTVADEIAEKSGG